MKTKDLLFFCALPLLLFLSAPLLPAQMSALPEVSYEQGKIVGSLPYGRHFFIIGSTHLPKGEKARLVEVKIWQLPGHYYGARRSARAVTSTQVAETLAGPPIVSSRWSADEANQEEVFRLYIDRPLEFASRYVLQFTYKVPVEFELDEDQKDELISRIADRVFDKVLEQGGITQSDIREIINMELGAYLGRMDEYAAYFSADARVYPKYENLPISSATLQRLSREIGSYSSTLQTLEFLKGQLAQAKAELDELEPGSEDAEAVKDAIASMEAQQQAAEEKIQTLRDALPDMLQIVRQKLVEARVTYTIEQPEALSMAEVDAIRIGTAFGGAMVGLNLPSKDRSFDALGYSALKFYLRPVDKRLPQPYLTGEYFVNRLSILAGVAFGGELEYRGQLLEKAIGVYPLLGFSFDVNRYMSIDVAATLFAQPSLSPLTQTSTLRVGPVIGINFDGDLFNRFQTMFSGSQYQINPGGN